MGSSTICIPDIYRKSTFERIREFWFGRRGERFLFVVFYRSPLRDAFTGESDHTKRVKMAVISRCKPIEKIENLY